ncbi:MAG: DUF1295 domain-containing protein [Legionellales bacterium]|nr:DUF1295 domain-containing protein [Legionellales bacterium]
MIIAIFSVVLFFHVVFFLALKLQDNSIADIAWGLGFILFSSVLYWQSDTPNPTLLTITVLIGLWGMRLSLHILWRKRGQGEDFRYQEWRKQWQHFFKLKTYLKIFMLQMFILFFIALPCTVSYLFPQSLTLSAGFGITLSVIGLIYEALADYQLVMFKRHNKTTQKIITTGLWAYSRHPNYFGEACFWWGIGIMNLSNDYWYLSLLSPIIITVLLRFVSGVPLLEQKYQHNIEFQRYKRSTSCMLPNPFKRKEHERS